LSRGADAVALAVAEECLLDPSCDRDDLLGYANSYATGNSRNDTTGLDYFEIDHDARQVEVITEAITTTAFLRVIGIEQSTVQARAVAEWGWLGAAAATPFTFPSCVWYDGTPEFEFIYNFQNIGETDCEDGAPPGGFGFLLVESSCTAETNTDKTAPGDPGTDWVCSAAQKQAIQGATIMVAIHDPDLTVGSGSNSEYTILGYAAFRVTGYFLPGQGRPGWPSGFSCPQGPGSACVRGYFTTDTLAEGPAGGADFGIGVAGLVE
jgi:hypothetical protein